MAEVARRAGVSLATVSRALAGSPLISDDTRRIVLEAAAQLEYRVDAAGSSLRTGLTRTIGVVIPLAHAAEQRLSDPFFLEMIGAIGDELAARGYSMLLSTLTDDPTDLITSLIGTRRADGIIVIGQSLHHEALQALAEAGTPMVVWGARLADQRYVTVGSDNEAGGYLATRHLLEQGCSRIVFLGDPVAPEVAARKAGYVRALREAGCRRDKRLELQVRFGSDTAYRAVAALLESGEAFDGIVACSDLFAMSAMRALSEHGRRVPIDVAVVGFDDIAFASLVTPQLTTIRQDFQLAGRLLVERLMGAMRGEAEESALLPAAIVVRSSSLAKQHRAVPSIAPERKAAKVTPTGTRRRKG
jgi:DNA-binding LacI/PurR family transcriptional regulator